MYYAPDATGLSDVRNYISALPQDEDPIVVSVENCTRVEFVVLVEVFGLHSNALITAQINQAKKLLEAIVSVQPQLSGGDGGLAPEEIVSNMVI